MNTLDIKILGILSIVREIKKSLMLKNIPHSDMDLKHLQIIYLQK